MLVARDIVVRNLARKATVWTCSECGAANGAHRHVCIQCNTKREKR